MPMVSARDLARCTGKIISMMPVIGSLARLMTRFLYCVITSRQSWDRVIALDSDSFCISELRFWLDRIYGIQSRPLSKCTCVEVLKVYSDASGFSCGAYIVDRPDFIFHNIWSNDDCNKSSTYREIKAVFLALRAYGNFLGGKL